MSTIPSSQCYLFYGGQPMLSMTDFALSFSKEIVEIAYLDSLYKEKSGGIRDWSMTFGGGVTRTADASTTSIDYDDLMFDMMNSGDASTFTVSIRPNINANKFYQGEGILSKVDMTGSQGSYVTWSGEIAGSNALLPKVMGTDASLYGV